MNPCTHLSHVRWSSLIEFYLLLATREHSLKIYLSSRYSLSLAYVVSPNRSTSLHGPACNFSSVFFSVNTHPSHLAPLASSYRGTAFIFPILFQVWSHSHVSALMRRCTNLSLNAYSFLAHLGLDLPLSPNSKTKTAIINLQRDFLDFSTVFHATIDFSTP
jgi:hypothetical protein